MGERASQLGTSPPQLSVARSDPERRLGLRGGRFTQPSHLVSLVIAAALTVATYGLVFSVDGSWLHTTLTQRGVVPYLIVLLSFWSLVLLAIKAWKVSVQRKALAIRVVPDDAQFVISSSTAQQVLDQIQIVADEPRDFILLNRIQIALSNLKNMGRIGDVDEILQSQSDHDESVMESSYTIVKGLVWGIPVLGFIGTVIGLSTALGSFGSVLASTDEVSELRLGLQQVTGGLALAFETTLQALVAALLIHLFLTVVRRNEERLLDDCREYCQRHIVGRIRLTEPR